MLKVIINTVEDALDKNILYINYNGDTEQLFKRMKNWVKYNNWNLISIYTDSGTIIEHELVKQVDGLDKLTKECMEQNGGYGGEGEYLIFECWNGEKDVYMLGVSRYGGGHSRSSKLDINDLSNKLVDIWSNTTNEFIYKKTKELLEKHV